MIQFLVDTTVAGDRYGMGALAKFDGPTESQLIGSGVAIVCPLPVLIAQSFVAIPRSSVAGAADAVFQTIASIVIPGGTMGLNSKLLIVEDWDLPNSSSTKFFAAYFGGSNISSLSLTTGNVTFKGLHEIQSQNSLTSQSTFNGISYSLGATNTRLATAIDTTIDQNIDFQCKWSASATSETLTLRGYSVWHYPGL